MHWLPSQEYRYTVRAPTEGQEKSMATMARKTWIAGIAVLAAFFFALLLIAAQPAFADHQPNHNPNPPQLTLEPPTATNTVGEQHCVTARLRGSQGQGNPIVGATIRFSVSGANTATGTGVTDNAGRATFCYTGTRAGEDMITAHADLDNDGQVDSGEPTAMVSKTYVAGPPATVTLEPAAATNTVGQQHCVTATVQDEFGNPVSGAKVVFTVTGVNPRGPTVVTTGANGQAQFCYTGQNAGPDTIRAFVDRDNDTTLDAGEPVAAPVTKTYLPRGPTTLTLSPPLDTNRTGEQHCVTATATNALGPASGVPIVFRVTGANTAGGTVTTNAQGQAQFCYTGQNVGPDLITAYADANNNNQQDATELVATTTKIYTPGAPATVTLEPPASENTVGTQHCVTAHVEDEFGNPTPGETVVFTVTGPNETGGSVRTDQNGNAVFCYTGEQSGLDTIRAFVDTNGNNQQDAGEPTAAPVTKLYHPGIPRTVTIEPKVADNFVGEEHCVTATAHDEFGNRVGADHPIVFEVTGANEAGPTTVTTNAEGQARFCYTGTNAGEDIITAYADNDGDGQRDVDELPGTATKTYRPGPPATVEVTPTTAVNVAGEEHCVTATVEDEFGNRVEAGTAVFFTVTGVNPTTDPVEKTTNANGQAEFCYTGTRAGTDTIRAVADANEDGDLDTTDEVVFGVATKVYEPGQPANLVLEPKTAT